MGAGWGFGDEFTSSQANALDINVTNAVDKRVNGDVVSGVLQMSGAGRIIPSNVNGTDANTTYQPNAGNHTIYVGPSAITANRVYTLGSTGIVIGDIITVKNDSTGFTITVQDGGAVVLAVLGLASISADCDAVSASFIFLGSKWTALYFDRQPRKYSQTFNSNGTWVCPRGVTLVELIGYGGGGGGGGGATRAGGVSSWVPGGGAGGGAPLQRQVVSVTPGVSYAIAIGAGGVAGIAGTNAVPHAGDGGDGSPTTFGALATFRGGEGGFGGLSVLVSVAGSGGLMPGGRSNDLAPTFSIAGQPVVIFADDSSMIGFWHTAQPGQGGFGRVASSSITSDLGRFQYWGIGGNSVGTSTTCLGGPSGTPGADGSTAFRGGGAGGGGGAGPGTPSGSSGAAPSGGNGGAGNASGFATTGTAGGSAAANTGAGGGGGGGSGDGTAPAVGGSAGGAGGSGSLVVSWIK